jgi:hypothetical protein
VLERYFPNLQSHPYQISSPADHRYNCIAWAAGDQTRWWWPDALDLGYWPTGAPRDETLDSFVRAFELLGFTVCDGTELEVGFEKIALYAKTGRPTHVARQLGNGLWTSKLGTLEDIQHTLDGLEGELYGLVVQIFRRRVE